MACVLREPLGMDPARRQTSTTVERKPYDDLRRARNGELRPQDEGALEGLLHEYFDHADDLEPATASMTRLTAAEESSDDDTCAA